MPEAEYDSPEHMRLMALNQENDPNIYTSIEPLEFTVRPKWTLDELENKIEWLERLIENPDLLGSEDYLLRDSTIAVPCNVGLYHEPLEKIPFDKEHEKQIGKCKTGITLDMVVRVYRKQLKQMREEGYDNTTDFISENYDKMLYWRPLRLPERALARMQPDAREKYEWMNSLTEPPEEYLEDIPIRGELPRERPSEASSWSGWYQWWDGYSNYDWNYYYNWNTYHYSYGWYGPYTPGTGDLCYISDDYGYSRDCRVYNANTARVYQVLVYDYDYLRVRSSRTLYIGNSGDGNWEYALYCESGSRIYCGDSGAGYINIDNYTSSTSCNAPSSTCQTGFCFTVDGYFYMHSGTCYLDDDLIVHGSVYHYNGYINIGYSSRSYDGALYISGSTSARYYHYDGYLRVERNFYTSGGYGSYGTGNGRYYGYSGSDVYVGYDGSSTCNNSRIYVYDSYSYFHYLRIYGTSNSYLYCSGGGTLDVNSHFYIRSGVTFHSHGYTMYVGDNFYDYGTFDHDNNTVYLDTANDGYIYGSPTFYRLRLTKSGSGDWMRIASNVTTYYLYLDEGRFRHDYSSYTMTIHYYVYCYAGAEYYQTTGTTNITYYDFNNRNGELDMRGGTMNINRHLYNNNGYSSNRMYVSGGTINAGYIPNYEGQIHHSGGTITSDNYYRELDSGGGNYYGSGSALLRLDGTGGSKYIRLMRSGTYFNDLTINGSGYYIDAGSTQNLNINRHFTINSGDSFDSNSYQMNVGGNWTNNGTFTVDNSYVYLDEARSSTIGGSSVTYFYYLRPNKSSRTYTITLNQNVNAYRVEPWRGTLNLNGKTLNCSTYFLANYDNNDAYDVTVNVGSGRINSPSGFQIRRGARVNVSSGIIDTGYFIVYTGANDGVMDMDGGTLYCSNYLRVDNGAYFYGDGGKVRMDGTSSTYIRNYNTTNSYFNDLEIYKTGSGYIYLYSGDIKVNNDLLVPLAAGTGGIEPGSYEILLPGS